MTRVRETKTTFTAGEVSADLLGRGDLAAYHNGALALRNVFIQPTGGIVRRPGLRYVDTALGGGRLIPFEFSTQQTYLLVLTDYRLSIYFGGERIVALQAPWSEGDISQLAWTQSADRLLLVHPDVAPQQLRVLEGGAWSLAPWEFVETEAGIRRQPYYKFAGVDVTVTPSAVSGRVALAASSAVFVEGHVGTRLRVFGCEVLVVAYNSPTVVTVDILEDLPDVRATLDWQEQAFSVVRGYPVTVAFHQDRLVIGGARSLPNRLWFSRSGDVYNFHLGEGLDDEAIEFSILSDQVNAIRGMFSGRHLQVFTSGAEWVVSGAPLSPVSVQILRQTRVGSLVDRYIPPVNVDGATLYLSRSKQQVQEFLYTDLEQAYQSRDLALLSPDMVRDPLDMDYDTLRRLLYVVRGDGSFSALTIFRAEQVTAWTLHECAGRVRSISVVGEDTYFMVERNGVYTVQLLDDKLHLDYAVDCDPPPDAVGVGLYWGLGHLEGERVSALVDGVARSDLVVERGAVDVGVAARRVVVGLPFTHVVEPLPPSAVGDGGGGRRVRLVKALFRLKDTAALRLDTGQGLQVVELQRLGADVVLDAPPPEVSGDLLVRALGWRHDATRPLWRIEQDTPVGFSLLSVTTQIKVND